MTTPTHSPAIVENESSLSFGQTVDALVKAIEGAGLKVVARIDHAGAAREVGFSMPPTVVLVYGHPRGGTPVMLTTPRAALDLPLKVLVREDGQGRVTVSFRPIGPALREWSVPQVLAHSLDPAQQILLAVGKT